MSTAQVFVRNVYGRTLVYPANATAEALAAFAGVRTFTESQLASLAAAGVTVEPVADPKAALKLPGRAA